jgi:hypothetical protein
VYTFAADAVDDCGCWLSGVSLHVPERNVLQIKHPGNYLRAAFPIEYLQLGKFDLPLVTSDASNLQFIFVRLALCGN